MEVVSIRQADLPGVRPLYADFLYDFSGVGGFYSHPPSLDAARDAAGDIGLDAAHRQRLVDELRRQNSQGDAATAASLDRLSSAGTVVVAAGQQVGLLGGPVFTLYKALTAVRCAEELTRAGTPAVPVFWLATEDHDLAEVNHNWAFGPDWKPRRTEAATEGEPGLPVGDVRITDAGLDVLEALFEGLPHAGEAVALARRAYGSAPFFGQGFRDLYRELLAGTGIVFLCPMEAGIRELSVPLLRKAIERAPDLTDALMRRGAGLDASGYHQQVHFQPSTSLVMLFEERSRVALKRKNGLYWGPSRSYTREELLRRLDSAPAEVSPGALLRPVMQDFLLPTAALVVGPSEAAYLGQSSVLYENLLARMPAVLPRATFTVLDGKLAKQLRRYGLAWTDCLVPKRELESAVAASVVPTPLRDSFESHRASIGGALGELESSLGEFDPTLAASLGVSRKKIDYHLAKIEGKVSREALRRSGTATRHAASISDAIYPNDNLQERVYGVLPFLARFGTSFVDRVRDGIDPRCADHRLLEL